MAIRVTGDSAGAIFSIKVHPGAGHNALAGEWEGALKVKIGKKPEKGAANRECLDFLADRLRVPRRTLTLVKGETSRLKVIRVDGLTPAQVKERFRE